MPQKLSLQEACDQIAQLPKAELLGMTLSYSGIPVFPGINREMPSVYVKGTGAEISAKLLEQEVTVFSEKGEAAKERIQTLDGKVKVERMLQGSYVRFFVQVDVVDPRYRRWLFLHARMVHYSYTVSGTAISI